ncbi:MAG TPA: enoyl-CoA hydratase-related protein [Candidatus Polarisedimenticolaceae bacterium]
MSDPATVRLSIVDGLARITLDRPPLNVLTIAMMRELASALLAAGGSPDVRVVRLDAAGKAFCAGVDVGDHVGDKLDPMLDSLDAVFAAFEAVPQPVVAAVHGAALGGGCEIVLGCDLCVASDAAVFGQPEIKLGVFAPPASILLPRAIGERRALEWLLLGESRTAPEAERAGLVNAVFPAAEFEQRSAAWVDRLLALSGPALRLAKQAVSDARNLAPREAREILHRVYRNELMTTADADEGLRSFLEKRKPVWTHR